MKKILYSVVILSLSGTTSQFIGSSIISAQQQGEITDVAQVLPESTIVVVGLNNPAELMESIDNHPLFQRLKQLPNYQQALSNPQLLQLGNFIETQLQMEWDEALSKSTHGGVYGMFDAEYQAGAMLLHGDDDTLTQVQDTIVGFVRSVGALAGQNPVKQGEYMGIQAYQIGETRFATHNGWAVVTNNAEYGRQILNRLAGMSASSLAQTDTYKKASAARKSGEGDGWIFANIATLQNNGQFEQAELGMQENMLVELLFGGILSQLKYTPFLLGSIDLEDSHIRFEVDSAFDSSHIPDIRRYYFGPDDSKGAPLSLDVPNQVLAINTYRDLGQWWLLAPDLFNDQVNERIALVDATLSTFFGGKDFGQDILASLEPEIQIISTTQSFDGKPEPEIKVPSFALVAAMKDPETMKAELNRTFISGIGFINIIGAMEGQPQFDITLEEVDGASLVSTKYLKPLDGEPIAIQYNFSPTIAFFGDNVVFSSTRDLALAVAKSKPASPSDANANRKTNFEAILNAKPIRDAIEANKEQFIVQTVLNDGSSREQAEAQVDLLLEGIGLAKQFFVRLDHSEDNLKLTFELQFKDQ